MGPVYLFVLVATAIMEPASGRISWQTVGYYETAAQCQTALIAAERKVDRTYVRLDCRPIKVTE
jgi:hypothetical protein